MYCPNCKTVFDNDSFTFCPKCGTRGVTANVDPVSHQKTNDKKEEELRCDRCGYTVGNKSFFTLNGECLCSQCGRNAHLDDYLMYSKFRAPTSAALMYAIGVVSIIGSILGFFYELGIVACISIILGGLVTIAVGGAIIDIARIRYNSSKLICLMERVHEISYKEFTDGKHSWKPRRMR